AIPNMVPVYEAQRSHRQASQSSGVLQMQKSPGDLEDPLVSRRVGHYGLACSCATRSPQLRCGPVIEGRSQSSRLVSSPTSDRSDLGAFFQGAGGPVREQAEHLLPAL